MKLNVLYDQEKLLNYDLTIDGNSKNMYLYLKDLYDKYLRFSFRNRPDTEPATWGQKEAIDKIQETWFIFCF